MFRAALLLRFAESLWLSGQCRMFPFSPPRRLEGLASQPAWRRLFRRDVMLRKGGAFPEVRRRSRVNPRRQRFSP
jgi:hypothetical protein